MPTFSSVYTPPGVFVQFLRENLSPDLTADYRIPVLIGVGSDSKTVKKSVTRGSTTKDAIGVTGVSSITRIGDTESAVSYVAGVDYTLGVGADADKVIWTTPGSVTTGSYDVNDLDFGSLSSSMVVTKTGNTITDSYVLEVTAVGTSSTQATLTGNAGIVPTLSNTETISITVSGTPHSVALANGDTRTAVLQKINTALTGVATAALYGNNQLKITTVAHGTGATLAITVVNNTLALELGVGDGAGNATLVAVAGTYGTGKYSITPRSSRVAASYYAGPQPITSIPGLTLTIASVANRTLSERAEIVTIADQIAKNPLTGATYYIQVVADKAASDYGLKYYTRADEEVFYADYGDPSSTNTLSLGAYVAFRNLTDIIGVVQLEGGTALANWEAAIDKLIDQPIYYIVPLTSNPLVQAYLSNHVTEQSNFLVRRERIGLTGGGVNYSQFDNRDSASALNNERMCFVAPSSWTVSYVDTQNIAGTATVDGSFAAVAVAAAASRRDPATPLTRRQIVGLTPKITYNSIVQNQLASKGCMIIEQIRSSNRFKGSVLRVRHQLTTAYNSPIESKELSLVQLRDYVSIVLRNNLDDEFVGTKILGATTKLIESYAETILEGLVQLGIITAFDSVTATQNDVDPTQIDLDCRVMPVYGLNYIYVTLKFVKQALRLAA